ncbi:MAG: insulinase family protein [Ignavibacteriae bacterium]|nr:insulinase family protein [Ignavibacteriota bacterium]NOG97334.1 insulinase family protein [Ignavibacteriota bacterium]
MNNILNVEYEKFRLKNGLEVILYIRDRLPIVSVNLWYKVGSANEVEGKTGFAHLFEHMMFQGSENVPKEKHFKYIQEAGGSLNGSTSVDRTNYYNTVPSNSLELVLWLESDRMGYLLPALTEEKLRNQKDVVMNERRQRYENQPYGMAWENIFANLYDSKHPYHWPTIGWMKDIEAFKLEDVIDFFERYYSPKNASLVIAGDIKIDETKALVEKYFEDIPNRKSFLTPQPQNVSLPESKLVELKEDVQLPRLYMAWHSDKLYGGDDAKLDVLSDVLSGSKNSRLYKSLVFDKQIAQDVFSFQYSAKINGSFLIVATAKPGVKLDDLKKTIFTEIDKLIDEGAAEKEINRSKNGIKSSFIYSLQNIETFANHLNNYNCNLAEPNSFIYDLSRYDSIGVNDIKNCAEKYLTKPFVELHVNPKEKS